VRIDQPNLRPEGSIRIRDRGITVNRKAKNNLVQSLLLGAAVVSLAGTAAYADEIETVIVTGSHIARPTMGDTQVPTVIMDADEIAKTGYTNLGAVLTQLPQIQTTSSSDLTPTSSNFLTSGFGVSNADLRELGAVRTLILVNGRRWVSGSPTNTPVDLNTIPIDLISRVDVITGGNSAAYGSDAVAGVVNIILKDDFEGVTGEAQYGKTTYNDGGELYLSSVLGGNFLDGKGNVAVMVAYDKSDTVKSGNRDLTQTDAAHFPGLFGCYGTSDCFLLGQAYSSYTPEGRFEFTAPEGAGGQTISVTGPYSDQGCTKATNYTGCTGEYDSFSDGYDRNPNRYIQVPVIRRLVSETGHIDIAPWLRYNLEASFAYTSARSQLEPYPGSSEDGLSKPLSAGGTGILIPLDNPYIPASLMAFNPGGDTNGLFFYRRFIDAGPRDSSVDRYMARVATGFDGNFGDLFDKDSILSDWKWNASFVWGRTAESQFSFNYYDKIKMQNALNTKVATADEIAAGVQYVTVNSVNYDCADPVAQAAGCVPIDLFGAYTISPQAAKYVNSLVTLQDAAVEQDFTASANGSILALPAGNVRMAFGYEYRRESAQFVPDAATQAGTVAGNAQPATYGHFDVHEVYAEGLLPVVKDLPMAEYVELDGSVRSSDYSSAGRSTSWNYGGIWQVIDDLKLRANESSSTRAPNIGELFSPPTQTFPGISGDLCSNPVPGSNAAINCATQIAALGPPINGSEPLTPTYPNNATGTAAKQGVGGYVSGNPNLKPEVARTFTGGIVLTPTWISNFQLTADYYDIKISGAIGSLDPQGTQQACYNSDPSGFATNVFCQQITRQHDVNLGPIIKQINFPTYNLGSIETSGVDATLVYSFDMADLDPTLVDAGSFNVSVNGTWIDKYNFSGEVGDMGAERWRGILRATYTNGAFSFTWSTRYIGTAWVSREAALGSGHDAHLQGNIIPSVWYHDVQASYDINDNWNLYAGAHNLFNTQPPETFVGTPFEDTGTGTSTSSYDPIGLFIYGGVKVKM
jgi:iron complex outermembrane receptor protein